MKTSLKCVARRTKTIANGGSDASITKREDLIFKPIDFLSRLRVQHHPHRVQRALPTERDVCLMSVKLQGAVLELITNSCYLLKVSVV